MDILPLVLLSVLPGLVIAAALSDLTTMRIPNWLSGSLIVAFFPAALAVGLPLEMVGLHGAVALIALLVGMGLFAVRVIGGGDAKLISAACLWLGPSASFEFILWTAVFGGVLSLGLIVARRDVAPHLVGGPQWVHTLMESKGDIPYGIAIAVGALMAFPSSALLGAFAAG
jgi:prepilin peptidase CpaA